VARGDGVVGGLGDLGEPGDPPFLPQGVEPVLAPRDELVGVGLVPHVKEDPVPGGVKDPVQGEDEFHRPQGARQVPAVLRRDPDDLAPDLLGQEEKFLQAQALQVLGAVHLVQDHGAPHRKLRSVRSLPSRVRTSPTLGANQTS